MKSKLGKRREIQRSLRELRLKGAISEMLIRGYQPRQIKYHMLEEYGLSKRVTQRLINKIHAKWISEGEEDMKLKRRRAILARKRVIAKAHQMENYDLVLRAEDSLSKIEGTEYDSSQEFDKQIEFNIKLDLPDKDSKAVEQFQDDLENPTAFDERNEKQLDDFCKKFNIEKG